jgi:hypothetical protein
MLLFVVLFLSLPLFLHAQEERFYEILLNEGDIPILGEKTKHEAALAKKLNAILKRWDKEYSIQYIKKYNDALAECKNAKTESVYYDCMKSNVYSFSLYLLMDGMTEKSYYWNTVPTANTSQTCRQILDDKFFLGEAKDYIAYNDNASDIKHLILTKYQGTGHIAYFYHKSINADANESVCSVRELGHLLFDAVLEEENWVGMYPRAVYGGIKMFSWNDTIYMSINNKDSSKYDIYAYDKESRFFDQVCKIERKTAGYKNSEPICMRVIEGKYKKIEPKPLNSIFDKEEIERLNAELGVKNETSKYWWDGKSIKKYDYTHFYDEGNNSYFADYRNEGEKYLLLNLDYASGAGSGCGYSFLAVYDPKGRDTIRYIDEKNDEDSEPSVFSDCFTETQEEIISIDGKNYILVSGTAGLKGLYGISVSDKGDDIVNNVCIFEPIYVYE